MHDQLVETFYLLSIAKLAQDWPELHPLRDRAMEKLRDIAKTPAHTTSAKPPPQEVQTPRPVVRPQFTRTSEGK